MTSEYTTYQCAQCDAKFPHGGPCPMGCKAMSEDRVREIAREAVKHYADAPDPVIDGAFEEVEKEWQAKQDARMREIAREEIRVDHEARYKRLLSEKDNVQRARDAALEEAADLVMALGREAWIKGNVGAVCEKIRSLKSQPAKPENVTSCPACGRYEGHAENCTPLARAFVEDALKSQPATPTVFGALTSDLLKEMGLPSKEKPAQPCSTCGAVDRDDPRGRFCSNLFHWTKDQRSEEKPPPGYTHIDAATIARWVQEMLANPAIISERSGDAMVLRDGGHLITMRIVAETPCERVLREWDEEHPNNWPKRIAAMEKERDALREKLADAEKALGEIRSLFHGDPQGNIAHFYASVSAVIGKFDRLGGKEQR